MPRTALKLAVISVIASTLPACGVAKTTGKVAALPFKAVYKTGELAGKTVYKTGEFAGKSVYHTGRFAGKSVYETGKFAGKTVAATGKGIYYIGSVPVKITDKALDTSARVLTLTTKAVDLSGKIVTVTRDIQAMELNAELQALKGIKGLLNVFVDARA